MALDYRKFSLIVYASFVRESGAGRRSREYSWASRLWEMVHESKSLGECIGKLSLLVYDLTTDMHAIVAQDFFQKGSPGYQMIPDMIEAQGYSFFRDLLKVFETPYVDLPLVMDSRHDFVNKLVEYRIKEGE